MEDTVKRLFTPRYSWYYYSQGLLYIEFKVKQAIILLVNANIIILHKASCRLVYDWKLE
jgi:hypothetical protein